MPKCSLCMAYLSTWAQIVHEKTLELGTQGARVTIVSQVLIALLSDNSSPLDLSMSRKAFRAGSSLVEIELPALKVSLTLSNIHINMEDFLGSCTYTKPLINVYAC